MAGKLVTIARYFDYLEASVAKQALAEDGIAAIIVGENLSSVMGFAASATDPLIELQVEEKHVPEATKLLEELSESQTDVIDDFDNEYGVDEPEEDQ